MNSPPLLTCHNVTLNRGGGDLVKQFSFALHEGDRIGLIGPNGSGKSTLLNVLGGLRKPEEGVLSIRAGCRLAFIEQSFDVSKVADETVFDFLRKAVPSKYDGETQRGRLEAAMREHCELLDANPDLADSSDWISKLSHLQSDLESLQGMDTKNIAESALRLARLGHLRERCVGQLSGGERKRLQIVGHLLADPDVVLLDEPTNHLDVETVEWLEEFLLEVAEEGTNLLLGSVGKVQRAPVAILIASHDRALLDTLVSEIVEIEAGQTAVYQGNYEYYAEAKLQREQELRSSVSKSANLFRRELAWLRAGVKARTTKQIARIDRAHKLEARLKIDSTRARAARSVALQFQANLNEQTRDDESGMLPQLRPLGQQELVRLEELWVRHPAEQSLGTRFVASDLTLTLKPRMRIALLGPNGCGKSTIFHAIRSGERVAKGKVVLHELARIAIFDQERQMLSPGLTVRDEICPKGDFVEAAGKRLHLMAYLDAFLFERRDAIRTVSELSGGEQARLLLAKIMLQDANVLLLDEPTNDLDIRTLQALEASFSAFAGSILFTSHDRYFISKVATHVLVWVGETTVGDERRGRWQMVADLEQALAILEKSEAYTLLGEGKVDAGGRAKSGEGAERDSRRESKKNKAGFKEARELASVESSIADLEERIRVAQLELERAYSEGKKHAETVALVNGIRDLEARLMGCMERWEELYSKSSTD